MLGILGILANTILPNVMPVLEKIIPDPEKREQAKLAMQNAILTAQSKELDAASRVIMAEANGSFLQRSWRPIMMYTFILIIANNYIFVPYATAFGFSIPALDIPGNMWGLLTVGIGGYIGARSVEKVMGARNANGS